MEASLFSGKHGERWRAFTLLLRFFQLPGAFVQSEMCININEVDYKHHAL